MALFRLSANYDCLPAYLHRFKLWSSFLCPSCKQDQIFNADHFDLCLVLVFLKCTVQRYWRARELMAIITNLLGILIDKYSRGAAVF